MNCQIEQEIFQNEVVHFESAALKLECIPEHRRNAVIESFQNAPIEITNLMEDLEGSYKFEICNLVPTKEGLIWEESHYSPSERIIRINDFKDDDDWNTTFRHEIGHHVDHMLDNPSTSENFQLAIEADYEWFDNRKENGILNRKAMLTELIQLDAAYSTYVSDILSGMFLNDTQVIKAYHEQGLCFYGHDTSYWFESTGPECAVNREIFANMFAIYAENNADCVRFIQKWFPNTTVRMKRVIGLQ